MYGAYFIIYVLESRVDMGCDTDCTMHYSLYKEWICKSDWIDTHIIVHVHDNNM